MMERLLLTVLPMIIKNVTPVIVDELRELLANLEQHAKETQNPWDDLFVALLSAVLNALGDDEPAVH